MSGLFGDELPDATRPGVEPENLSTAVRQRRVESSGGRRIIGGYCASAEGSVGPTEDAQEFPPSLGHLPPGGVQALAAVAIGSCNAAALARCTILDFVSEGPRLGGAGLSSFW
ncbi:hypothetical protein P2H44_07635 [Albimonas sp. CAU 1670]|uniref:hypothetical protein n=1 Tax=Albimonas sp. CAU 1670 TaxID=3032599 RepID=UPI0023D9C905|nr:hypothetical protein [Albimonas sp. CAU 1670]MDF2232420.1 hypothetical protein [Albimonas sp. CAU 1670]